VLYILRMRAVTALDSTAMNALDAFYSNCSEKGVQLILSHVNEQPLKLMKKSGFFDTIGEQNFTKHIDDALKLTAK